ncbi:MAG: right-handed parallel beta-helix repeat-containing protein [Planctomycetota bacterium]|jgi:hypothetical protein
MERKKARTRAVAAVLVLAVLALFSFSTFAGKLEPGAPPAPTMKTLDEVQPRVPVQSLSGSVTSQYLINQPGSYYLTGNITVSTLGLRGIQVDCNDVTIDLCGFALTGPGKHQFGSGSGIYANSVSNLAAKNGTVRDFTGSGIELAGTSGGNHLLTDLRLSDNRNSGILAYSSCTIIGCTAARNLQDGIYALHSTIINCTTVNNGSRGMLVSNGTAVNCIANNNGNAGIQAVCCTIIDSVANYNKSTAGIFAAGPGTILKNCAANNNTNAHGIRLENSSAAIGCNATDNQQDGIWAQTRSTVLNCTAHDNSSDGIQADYRCRIQGNHLRYNSGYGLNMLNSYNYAVTNVASNNGSGNFSPAGGTNYMPTVGDNANYSFP